MVFGGACRALDGEARIVADCSGEQFRQHRFGCAWFAHQHQALFAHQSDNGAVNQGIVAVKFAADIQFFIAQDEGAHAAGRQIPICRLGRIAVLFV